MRVGSRPGPARGAFGPRPTRARCGRRWPTTERGGRACSRTLGRQPYHDLPDLDRPPARRPGGRRPPRAAGPHGRGLVHRGRGGDRLARGRGASARRVSPPAPPQVRDTTEVAAAIRRAILPSGEVADDASPEAGRDLRADPGAPAQPAHSVMESYLRGKDAERLLQDKVVTTRNDRYVLLLKAEHRASSRASSTAARAPAQSVFVEPLPAVELNNDIVQLQDEERREVIRILPRADRPRGRARRRPGPAVERPGRAGRGPGHGPAGPRHGRGGAGDRGRALELELPDARHPLLMPALAERLGQDASGRREPVPVSLRLGFGEPVLVISGPNTGGKTVALKTVGLLRADGAVRACTCPPRAGARLPVFQRVFADIGDEQSIADQPVHLLRAPGRHRGDDARPRPCPRSCCSTRWARAPIPPRAARWASPSSTTSAGAGPWWWPPPTTA